MRIRRGREGCALIIPPDVESSTLQPPPPPPPPPPPSSSSSSLPINSSNIITYLDEQDALVLGTGEDDYTTKGLININPVATTSRKCGTDDPSSDIAAHDTDSSISSSSSHVDVGGSWVEEDKDLPLKKRRLMEMDDLMIKGSKEQPIINNITSNSSIEEELKSSNQTRPKRKRTEKIWRDYVLQVNWVSENHQSNNNNNSKETDIIRCNRHNGKGWRCSSPAVAGHNLCEHHFTEQKKKSRKKT